MTLTVNQMIDGIRSRLDEPAAAQWSNVELKRWINEGLRDLGRRTKHFRDTRTFTTVAGQAAYTLAGEILEVELVYFGTSDGRQIPLVARAFEGMNNVWGQHQGTGGQPAMYTMWGVPPNLRMHLYPVPDQSSRVVTMYVVRLPNGILEIEGPDGSPMDVPPAWVDLLKDYAEFCALRKDRKPYWQESFQLYNQRVDDLIVNSDYMDNPREMIADPLVAGGVVPRWIADPGWGMY